MDIKITNHGLSFTRLYILKLFFIIVLIINTLEVELACLIYNVFVKMQINIAQFYLHQQNNVEHKALNSKPWSLSKHKIKSSRFYRIVSYLSIYYTFWAVKL